MPRRRPGRVRAELARPRPTDIHGVPLSVSRALDRRSVTSQQMAFELATWHRVAHLPAETLRREHSDWTQLIGPAARCTLERGMNALPARRSAPLRKLLEPLDELFAVKTLPDPSKHPSLPWWCRRY